MDFKMLWFLVVLILFFGLPLVMYLADPGVREEVSLIQLVLFVGIGVVVLLLIILGKNPEEK